MRPIKKFIYAAGLVFSFNVWCVDEVKEPLGQENLTNQNREIGCPALREASDSKARITLTDAICGRNPELLKQLINEGHMVTELDCVGISHLHMAASLGYDDIMEILIGNNAQINLRCGTAQNTPAHSATKRRQLSSIKTLVKHNACLKITNADKKTCQDIACEMGYQEILNYFDSLK